MYILAPLLGLTNARFRSLFAQHFKGFDYAIAPFISVGKKQRFPKKLYADLISERNTELNVIPQLIGNDAEAMTDLIRLLQKEGYSEVNINLGCPMPLVAKKKRGSGLLPYPDRIKELFDILFEKNDINISVKTRLGYHDTQEIDKLIDIFNSFPFTSVCIHPRTGKQQYSGKVDLDRFADIYPLFKSPIIYNGDIQTTDDLRELQNRFPDIQHWMIGRAALKNPFILEEFFYGSIDDKEKKKRFAAFVGDFYIMQSKHIQSERSLLNVMKEYWQYFSAFYPEPDDVFTYLKRCKTKDVFEKRMWELLDI